jgi:hypothetical protein
MNRLLATTAALVIASSVSAGAVTLSGPGYDATVLRADCDSNGVPDSSTPIPASDCPTPNNGGVSPFGPGDRTDLRNIELDGIGDGQTVADFYSLGVGGSLFLEFDPSIIGGPGAPATVVEVTNIGSSTIESAEIWVSNSVPFSEDLTNYTLAGEVDNSPDGDSDRRNTSTLQLPLPTSGLSWRYLAFVDTSSQSEDGFDIDALAFSAADASTEIPLPASVLFLLSGLGALAAVRRRRA